MGSYGTCPSCGRTDHPATERDGRPDGMTMCGSCGISTPTARWAPRPPPEPEEVAVANHLWQVHRVALFEANDFQLDGKAFDELSDAEQYAWFAVAADTMNPHGPTRRLVIQRSTRKALEADQRADDVSTAFGKGGRP